MTFRDFLSEKVKYKKITFSDGKNTLYKIMQYFDDSDIPKVGDEIDSAATTLDYKSPDYKVFNDVKIKKIIKIEDY